MAESVIPARGDARPRLTRTAARHLMLEAQGLGRRPRGRARADAVLGTIRRMAVLQIDTIHVVERSPYLVLFSRLGAYDPTLLDDLLAEGRIFEYWAQLASSSTATLSGSTATPSGSTVRTSGSTAPAVLLAFCLLAIVFQRATTALAVVPLLGAVVPLCAGCEDNGWIFPHL
jgi:hypothetical protein